MAKETGIPVKIVWGEGTIEYRLCFEADIEWMLRNPSETMGTPTFRVLRNFEEETETLRKSNLTSTERV